MTGVGGFGNMYRKEDNDIVLVLDTSNQTANLSSQNAAVDRSWKPGLATV